MNSLCRVNLSIFFLYKFEHICGFNFRVRVFAPKENSQKKKRQSKLNYILLLWNVIRN